MVLMGRNPKPATALKLSGSWRATKRGKSEPEREPALPDCPAWLCDVGKQAWADWLPRIAAMQVMSSGDRDALAIACDTWARYLEARQHVLEMGEVVPIEGRDGETRSLKRNPWSQVLAEHGDRLRRMLSEFGLTPVGRARVGAAKENAKNAPEEDFFSKRRA